ncbi:MAG: hypothetical protein O3C23_02220, partial [bacterium]|nr:hypothetical protein [bacterium]
PHAPCAAAVASGINIAQQIAFAKAGKARILRKLPVYKEQHIACLFHISEDAEERTYKVSATHWKQWAERNMPAILQVA